MISKDDLDELFEEYNDEYLEFHLVTERLHSRRDIHAFLLFDKIMNLEEERPIIGCARHDEVFLDVDVDKFCDAATKENVIDLIRCGVRYDESHECFCMFA